MKRLLRRAALAILLLPFAAILAYVLWPTPHPPAPPPKQYQIIAPGAPVDGSIDQTPYTFPIGEDTYTVPRHYILEHITVGLQFIVGIAWPERMSIPEAAARERRLGLPPGSVKDVLRIQVFALTEEHRAEVVRGRAPVPMHDTAESFRFDQQAESPAPYVQDSRRTHGGLFRTFVYGRKPDQSPVTYFELLDPEIRTPKGNEVFAECGYYKDPNDEACYIRYDLAGNSVQLGFNSRHLGGAKEMYLLSRQLLDQFRGR